MEIPPKLKDLYKHWELHTVATTKNHLVSIPSKLEMFIAERMRIWEKKNGGAEPPYTRDEILQKYRFCNIYRELDKQTIEIHTNLNPLLNNFPLWLLNISFQRFIGKPSTVLKVGKLSFDKNQNADVFKNLCSLPKPKYGNAYVFPISVIQKSEYPTRENFFCHYLPRITTTIAEKIGCFENMTVNKALDVLLPIFGFNFRFHWAEILIDVAYQFPQKIDLFHNFYIGTGALPTAKLINPEMIPTEVVNNCVNHNPSDFPYLTYNNKKVELSAENWEGIFCEYRKYTHLEMGKGRIRRFAR